MTEVRAPEALGELLSPSQAKAYLAVLPLPDWLERADNGRTVAGQGISRALARNFRQKLSTGRDMENGELSEAFAEEWSLAIADAALRDDEDARELALTGKILVQAYLSEAARSVNPRAIEQTVQGEIAGVKVRGKIGRAHV